MGPLRRGEVPTDGAYNDRPKAVGGGKKRRSNFERLGQTTPPLKLWQKVHWTSERLAQIEGLRKQNPTWGRWPIWLALKKQGLTISERTVDRILAYLERRGRVESVAAFLARSRRGKLGRRGRRPYAPRKPKAVALHENDITLTLLDSTTKSGVR